MAALANFRNASQHQRDAGDEYRARAGPNARSLLEGARVVRGQWMRGDEDLGSIDEWNTRIADWDRGYNEAVGARRDPTTGAWMDTGQYGTGHPGGGASTDRQPPTPGPVAGSAEDLIARLIRGDSGPYTRDVIGSMKSSAYDEFAGGLSAQNRAAMNRASRMGGIHSASAGAEAAENERVGRAGLGQQFRGIEQEAAKGNFQARIQGLTFHMQNLQREAEERMAQARDATEREAIRMQYQGLMDSTRAQIAAQKELAASAQAAAGAAAGRGRAWELEDWERNRNAFLEDRDYEEQWRMFAAAQGSGYEMPIF